LIAFCFLTFWWEVQWPYFNSTLSFIKYYLKSLTSIFTMNKHERHQMLSLIKRIMNQITRKFNSKAHNVSRGETNLNKPLNYHQINSFETSNRGLSSFNKAFSSKLTTTQFRLGLSRVDFERFQSRRLSIINWICCLIKLLSKYFLFK